MGKGWLRVPALLIMALLAIGGVPRASPASARPDPQPALRVVPFPRTPDAVPNSTIIFSSLARREVRSVDVSGSRSGLHGGRLQALPDGAGTEFVPDRAFAAGEEVHVSAQLTSAAAGTAAGDPGATRLTFSFGVATPATPPDHASRASSSVSPTGPTRSFHSEPDLHPPLVKVSRDPDKHSGDIFLSPINGSQTGLMILNSAGQLVWYDSASPAGVYNLQVQRYQGKPVLTWWQSGAGNVIVNRSYQRIATVRETNGYEADAHDFVITPQGTAWLMGTEPVEANLTKVGGPSTGTVSDFVIQKVDISTGQLLWEWHAYGHIPLQASHARPHDGHFDAYHLNSLQALPDGSLLVSSRSTWSVYDISTTTGKILWTLGGKHTQFKMGRGTRFEWQHDARLAGHTLTLFDDAATPQEEPQSSAKELDLDIPARTVTLIKRFTHDPPLLSGAQGSTELLADGNVFVGWGTQPDFSEYNPSGRQIVSGSFTLGVKSYRALRFPWNAHPAGPPSVATAAGQNGSANVWASWDGATNVATWRVLGGPSCTGALFPVTSAERSSFETQIILEKPPACVEVQALNGRGKVLGTSSADPVG